jgi:hypothetical protein
VVLTIYEWIQENKDKWDSPDFRYNPERVLEWKNKEYGTWEPIETHKLYRAKVER